MAIGAMHVAVLAIVTVVLLAAAVLTWSSAEPMRARRSASLVFWTGVALTVWTAISVVPIPAGWLEHLSPHAADIWARCLTPLGQPGPARATLSLDPVATRIQVLRGVTYLLAFVTAVRIAGRREGVVFLERAIVVTAAALALAAILHPALGAEKVFGLYLPRRDPGARHVAPILNSNALSGYLNIGISIVLAQVLSPRAGWPRSLLATLWVALVALQVWVASRGGLAATGLSAALVVWITYSKGPDDCRALTTFLVPAVLVLLGVGATILASSDATMGELATLEVSKLDLARAAFRIVPDFPVFGIGRGAFESVFPGYRTDVGYIVYTHPENIVAQWVTEWGVAPAVLAFLALFVALRPASAIARTPRAAGAWAAVVCLGVQSLVDFGSEYPAVVIALATCVGIITGGTSGTNEPRKLDAWATSPRRLVAAVALASLVSLALVIPGWHHDLFDDREALHASAIARLVRRADFDALAASAMLRHPAEPYLPFTGALRAVRTGESSVIPWIERTVELALVYGPAHLLLARWLTPRSPSQARLEYRLTLEQAPELSSYVLPAMPGLVHGYDDALEVIPRTWGGTYWLDYLGSTVAPSLPATARRLDDLIAAADPDSRGFAARRAEEGIADVTAGVRAPWCMGDRRASCLRDALARASRFAELAPTECRGHAIRARLLIEEGETARALKELRAEAETVADRTTCFEELANLAETARSDAMITQALDCVAHAGCADTAECVANLRFVATHEVLRGNHRMALAALQRARAMTPEDDALLAEVAALASKVDLHAEALRSYETLAQRHPDDPRWPAAIAAERLLLVEGSIPY